MSAAAVMLMSASSSLLDGLGRVRRVKAKPLTRSLREPGHGGHGPRDGSYEEDGGGAGTTAGYAQAGPKPPCNEPAISQGDERPLTAIPGSPRRAAQSRLTRRDQSASPS